MLLFHIWGERPGVLLSTPPPVGGTAPATQSHHLKMSEGLRHGTWSIRKQAFLISL